MIKRLLAALAIGALALTGCASRSASAGYYDTICVDPLTQLRQPDYYCQATNPFYHPAWIYYVPSGYIAPAYGVHITNYNFNSYHRPSNATVHMGGVSATGGKATKFSTGNVTIKKGSVYVPPKKVKDDQVKVGSVNKDGYNAKPAPRAPAPRAPAPRAPAPVRPR